MGTDSLTLGVLLLSFEGHGRQTAERIVADILARDAPAAIIGGGADLEGGGFDIEVQTSDPDGLVARIEAALTTVPELVLVAAVWIED